jgi:hypothetical protein
MPLQIQRTANVYQLWDDDDLKSVFVDHLEAGWLTTLTYTTVDGVAAFRLTMQNAESRQLVNASLDDVVVSDLVTVIAQTVDEYNEANPNNTIEEPGS